MADPSDPDRGPEDRPAPEPPDLDGAGDDELPDDLDGAGDDEVTDELPDDLDGAGDDEVTDELPDDLDASGFVGPYLFPNNSRRRIPGVLYIVLGAGAVGLWAVAGPDAVLSNAGFAIGGGALILVGLYHLQAGWDLAVDENDALVVATRSVGFPVGHASAQLGWRGLRSRPTWRILLYSNESPPDRRGLVMVDGVDGEVIDQFTEANPEDWSDVQ